MLQITNGLEIKGWPPFQISTTKISIPSTPTFLSSLIHHFTPGHCLCHRLLLPSTRCATTTATAQALEKAPTLKGPASTKQSVSLLETCKQNKLLCLVVRFRFLQIPGAYPNCVIIIIVLGLVIWCDLVSKIVHFKQPRNGVRLDPPIPHLFRCKARSKTEISGGRKKDWPSKKRANLEGLTSKLGQSLPKHLCFGSPGLTFEHQKPIFKTQLKI